MSRKTRKLIWAAPLLAVFAVAGALALFMTLTPHQAAAQDEEMLGPPTGLTAVADGQTKIKLSWTGPTGEVSGYRVDVAKDADGAVWEQLLPPNSAEITIVGNIGRYTDDEVKAGKTQHYRVFAIDGTGDEGEPSSSVSATTAAATKSAAPTTLSVVDSQGSPETDRPKADRLTLQWAAPPATGGSAITSYKIQHSDTSAGPWEVLKTLTLASSDLRAVTTPITGYRYTNKGLTATTTRHYRVIAINGVGESDPSNQASGTTIAAEALTAPLKLQVQGSVNQVMLYWVAPPDPAGAPVTGYRIQRRESESDDSGTPNVNESEWKTIVADTRSKATVYRAGGAIHKQDDPATTDNDETDYWRYRVNAINADGLGADGQEQDAENLPKAATHSSVASLKATTVSRSSVRLTWNMPLVGGTGDTSYTIFASKNGVSWTFSPSAVTAVTYDHTNGTGGAVVKASETWHYRVFAQTGDSRHVVSAVKTATTSPADTPAAPTTATAAVATTNTTGQINLTIAGPAAADNGGAAVTGYQIRRSTDQISWETIAANFDNDDDLTATNIQYQDKGLSPGTAYYYEVRAVNSAGAGAPKTTSATTVSVSTVGIPPSGLVAVARNSATVDLYWLTPDDAGSSLITGYWIEVSENSGTTWSNVVSDTMSKATTYTHMGAPAGKTLAYRVSAINSAGAGVASINEEVTTPANTAPAAADTAPTAEPITAGMMAKVQSSITDADMGDTLTWSVAVMPADGSVATATVDDMGMVTITAVAAGSATITVTATDAAMASASETIAVTVVAANAAPTNNDTPALGAQTVSVDLTVMVESTITDADTDDVLTWEATDDGDGEYATATVNQANGMVTITGKKVGSATITVTATDKDGSNMTATQTIPVSVVNAAPMATDKKIADLDLMTAGSSDPIVVSGYFMDSDKDAAGMGQTLTYSATSSAPAVATVTEAGSPITVKALTVGTATITVTATDPAGAMAEQKFMVTVTQGAVGKPTNIMTAVTDTDPGMFNVNVTWTNGDNAVTHVAILLDSNFEVGKPPRVATAQDSGDTDFTVTEPGTYYAVVAAIDAAGKYDYAVATVEVGQ